MSCLIVLNKAKLSIMESVMILVLKKLLPIPAILSVKIVHLNVTFVLAKLAVPLAKPTTPIAPT